MSTLPTVNSLMTALTMSVSSAPVTQHHAIGNPAGWPCFLEPLDLPNKRVIFLANNNNSTHTARKPTGVCWFIYNIKMAFIMISSGSKSFHAKKVAEKLETFLGRKGNELTLWQRKPLLNKTAMTGCTI